MVSVFSGKLYKLDSSKNVNFDEYMKALGVGLITRKLGNTVCPTIMLTVEGDQYTLKTLSTFKNSIATFQLGVEFDHETPDGRKVKTTITEDGNKLVEVQVGEKTTTLVREFSATEVKCIMTVDDIVSTRLYVVV